MIKKIVSIIMVIAINLVLVTPSYAMTQQDFINFAKTNKIKLSYDKIDNIYGVTEKVPTMTLAKGSTINKGIVSLSSYAIYARMRKSDVKPYAWIEVTYRTPYEERLSQTNSINFVNGNSIYKKFPLVNSEKWEIYRNPFYGDWYLITVQTMLEPVDTKMIKDFTALTITTKSRQNAIVVNTAYSADVKKISHAILLLRNLLYQ